MAPAVVLDAVHVFPEVAIDAIMHIILASGLLRIAFAARFAEM